jgi:DNA (cytosine-5)-methyltransferase 1
MNYYNEFDPFAAQWLRNLIAEGLIPKGIVDDRSIKEVVAADLAGFRQCHFFAGIGGWSYALQLAAWPEEREVWTGSCPCPPFSSAGKKKACPGCGGKRPVPCPRRTGYFICCECSHAWLADERHLWPEFWRLISERRPSIVFGEQVSGADGLVWFAGVRASLEICNYRVGAVDMPAACVGSPNIRQRLWWVGHPNSIGQDSLGQFQKGNSTDTARDVCGLANADIAGFRALPIDERDHTKHHTQSRGELDGLAHSECRPAKRQRLNLGAKARVVEREARQWERLRDDAGAGGNTDGLGDASSSRLQERTGVGSVQRPAIGARPWEAFELASCRDGKARRLEPGCIPLAHGLPNRVGRLRGYGNAINPYVAAEFIQAYLATAAK